MLGRRPFLAAVLASSGALLLWCSVAFFLRKRFGVRGPGISGLVMRVPGAKYVTATPDWLPESRIGAHNLPHRADAKDVGKEVGKGAPHATGSSAV